MPIDIQPIRQVLPHGEWVPVATRPASGTKGVWILALRASNATSTNNVLLSVRFKSASGSPLYGDNNFLYGDNNFLLAGKNYPPLLRESWQLTDKMWPLSPNEILEVQAIALQQEGEDSWIAGTNWNAMEWTGGVPTVGDVAAHCTGSKGIKT